MKLKILLAGMMAVALLAVSSAVSAAPVTNGSFEAGLSGWTSSSTSSSGFVEVVSTCPTSGTPSCPGPFAPYQPAAGSRFALLWSRGNGTMTLRSTGVLVEGGSLITGRVFFADGELAASTTSCDTATVRVFLDSVAQPVTLFSRNSCATSSVDSTSWTAFQYNAPYQGVLSVEATLTNAGNSERDSAMGLDAVLVTEPPRRSLGAFLGGADGTRDNLARQAQAAAAAQQAANAAAAAAAQAAPALRPPSTGDAGLLDQGSGKQYGLLILLTSVAATVVLTAALARKLGVSQR